MSKRFLIILVLHFFQYGLSQNIGGVINSYAAVINIAGSSFGVSTTAGFLVGDRVLLIQMKGAAVVATNNNTFGNITAMNSAGNYELLTISAISGSVITCSAAPINSYNTAAFVQLVRVPVYCQPTVTSTLTCLPWSAAQGTGGILALEAGTITLNSDMDVTAMGFKGGNFASSGFCCSNGNYAGAFNGAGGQKGESISNYLPNQDGLKGKQANGGGGSNCGNSGGGGGGNGGAGGMGGNQYSGCGSFDDRGFGGLNLSSGVNAMFLGGGGGGGFRDNGQSCTAGGNGGGIIYIRANTFIGNNRIITASGASVTTVINDEGAGGGGSGGSVFIECSNMSGLLTVRTTGGSGGSNLNTIFTSDCHGPGGGGGGGVFAYSSFGFIGGVTFIGGGGPAGTVNNLSSGCYNTTFGATAGATGYSLAVLPTPNLAFSTPTLSVIQNTIVCAGQSATLLAFGATTYSWVGGPSTFSKVVTPLGTTVYTVIGASGCTASAQYTVSIVPGPTLNFVGTNSICTGQSATMNVGGANTYSWNTGSTSSQLILFPSATTAYTVTGNSGGCNSFLTHTIFVVVTPTVSISGNTLLCSSQSATLIAGTASNYLWNTSATASSIIVTPSVTTTYTVVGSNSSCTVSATHTVLVDTTPTLSISGPTFICTGSSATISVSGATGYLWNTGSTAGALYLTPLNTAVYTVTGSIASCTSSLTHTLNVVQTPYFTLSGAQHICSGQSATLVASGANTYLWNTGSNSPFIVVSPPVSTTYSVVSANQSCSFSAQITVTVTTTPTINISTNTPSLCTGGSVIITASGASAYLWTFGATTNTILVTPQQTTIYYMTGTNGNCATNSSITIFVSSTPTLISGSYSICTGVTSATAVVSGAANYIWSPQTGLNSINSATVIANPIAHTIYTVIGTTGACSAAIQVPVYSFPIPIVTVAATETLICQGKSVSLNALGANGYRWEPSADFLTNNLTSYFLVPSSTKIFTVYGYGPNNCMGYTTITIIVLETPQIFVGSEQNSICKGDKVTLSVSGADRYVWSPPTGLSNTSQSITIAAPSESQNYVIIGTKDYPPHSCSSTATVVVNVMPYTKVLINAPDSVCYAQTIHLFASGAKHYTWTPGQFLSDRFVSNPAFTPTSAILYTVTGVGTGSCAASNTVLINVKPRPFAYAGRDTVINFDQDVMLNGDGDGWLYTWRSHNIGSLNCINCPTTLVTPAETSTYTLDVQNSHGCVATDDVRVEVTNDHAIYIPNSFSPNNDNINDIFMPRGFGVISYELLIYDRWGELVHQGSGSFTKGIYDGWDGKYKGELCKADSYVYIFTYVLTGSKTLTKDGNVVLLHPKP